MQDFQQFEWDERIEADCRAIVRLALQEDLEGQQDWTTVALVPEERVGRADVVAREAGIAAGLPAVAVVLEEMSAQVSAELLVSDGEKFDANQQLIRLEGSVRELLTLERTLLNLLSRLMGIATLAGKYTAELQGTDAKVLDTRKTTPGWRRLEKYAANCGGAFNHRMGLYDAVLIKDNHLAQRGEGSSDAAAAVSDVRSFLRDYEGEQDLRGLVVEIEVDNLDQLASVLPEGPDIVLLDNMPPAMLREAVQMRDELASQVLLEASGGVRLKTVREIAGTGVERISVGALTHSARSLDIGLDWKSN